MLPAWYFCCCLNATTDKATVFLSILEIFENHDGESELVPIALGELQRADLWMQIYALSAVLGLRRAGDAGPALRAVIDEYLENLIQHLPDEASEAFRSLNASLTAGPEDTRGAVRACSKAISKLPPRRTTSTPYLDLKEFLPETYLLSVVLDRVLTDDAFAFVVAKELDDRSESSVFDAVLDAALTHALGRLAFCAAVRIAHAASSEHSEHALLSRICTCSTAPLALQPDLLHACAEILFRRPGAGGAASPVKEIVFESILFTRLRALALIEPRREKDPSAPLGFVGLLGNEGLTQALMLVYWQAVLWELAVRLDPVEAAPILAVLWAPRVGGRHDLTVLGPVPRAEIDIWDHQLRALLRLRDERGLRLVVRSGKNVEAGRDASWALFSPWLALNPDPGKWTRFDIHDLRYPGATSAPLLVRLLVAATAAVRVLRRAPPEHESRGALAAVIAHAADVLDLFRTDLTPGGRRDPLLRRQFFSLARHARTQVTLAGSGELASIDPAEFVSYVRWVHHARPGERPRGDHGAFFLSILPGVLLTWAAEALPCAVSTSGAIRWFPLIHEVYDYYRPHRPSFPHHLVTSLLLRFVEPGFALDVDWCDFRDTIELGRSDRGRGEKSVRYEQILLARDVPVEVWLEPYWRSQRLWPNSALALALARLAALEQADTTTDVQERWHSEWVALVNRARSTDDLPIFLRLRLLELLDAPVLAGRPEEQTLICLTLLEHGSIHELERLFKRVFATDEEGFQRQIPETRRQVRLMLLRALHQHAAMAGDDVASRPNAQDPRRTLEEAARRALVRRMMVILAYFNPPSLSAVLTELHADTLKPRTEASRRSTGHLDGAGTQRRVVRGADDIAVRDGAVQAAVYDRNRLVVSLFADDFDTGDCLDLFEADPADAEAVRNLVEAHPLRVLAWVVDTKDRRDGHWFYTFHCGLDYYVTSIERWLGVAVGDCVELPIQPSVDRSRWVVIRNGDIGQFKGKLRPGDVEELRLTETGPYRELHLNAKKVPREILALWDPDRSRAFAPGPVERRPRAVLARFRPGLLPAPLELDLIHLLLHARRGAAGSPFVLTFAGTVTTALGEQAFQLSAQPGQSYVLRVEQFASEDAGRLRDMLIDAHRGMLVVLSARLEGGEVRLGLAAAAAETPDIARRYPGLTAPFDDRNLRWRQVLSGDETEIAEWSGHDWMIHLHDRRVPGFPEAVRVEEWEGTRFSHHDRSRVELVVTHWASRRGVVRGRHVPFDQLEVSNTAEFFRRWWHLGPGLRVTIARYGRDVQDDGYVTCYTPENIRVKVEPESLTMRPWDHEVRAELGAERQVQLFEAEFRKPKATPEIDPTELPAVAHEMGCCFGILKRVPSRTDVKATLCAVLWSNDGHVTEGNLTLANLAELRPSPGWRLEGERDARGVWWFRLLYYVLRGRALWSIEEAGPRDANLLYLGKVSYQGQPRAIAERRPGNLVLLPSAVPGAQHLSRGSGARFTGGIERGQETVNTPRAFSWVEGGRVPVTLRRAVLRLRSSILSGDCHADAPETNVAWAGAELALVRHDDDLVWLRRLLLLEPIQRVAAQRAVARQARPIADVATQRRKEMESALERYFESPTDLEAAVLAAAGSSGDRRELGQERVELRTLRVPAEGAGSRWVSTVDMAPGEGAFVLGQDYPREPAVVRLLRDGGGRVFASCREVPPYTAQEYRKKLNVRYGEPARPDGLFHYVGPEQRSAENGEPGETHHRFEWGYGSTLLVPERCLRFAGGPFANARLALFHGDLIESVTFSLDEATEPEREGPSSARAHDGECVMSIDGAYIKQSEGSVLYKERTRYTLVHHLEIVLGDDLEVVSVLGCTKKLDANSHDYERVRARLDDASKKRLLQRFGAAADDDGERAQRIRVLGRLDDAVFRATFGRVVEFRHVRMSFRDSPLGPPLHHNEALFVQTNGARPTRSQNDIELRLKPFQGMPEDEIGDDIRNDLMLLRGRFSTRRGLLPRLHRERSEILQDSALLVRIQQDEDGRPLVSLRDNIPPRPPESLASAIAKESSALLATVVSATPRGVLLELRPGVFVHLGPDRLGATPYNFDAGTIVSVENRPHASFEITRAAFSDARYVGEEPRPVVVLPKSSPLLRDNVFDKWDVEDPSFWTAREDFTIGSLPNLVAQAGSYDEGTGHWSGPRAEDCITLLETPHPKIARVARRNDRIYVTRPSPDDAWGWLELQGREREVSLVWFHGDEEHRTEAEWSELTFADEPANRVQSRVRRERWRYHDARTGHWSAQGVVSRELREHDAETGPLFFELVDARPRLRYRPGSLLRNGFPVDELVQSLLRAGPGGASYPVAGPSHQGVWIELTPGRVVELPGALVVRLSEGAARPLSELHWAAFAPGDRVELKIASRDSLTLDRVALHRWTQGPRGAFGPGRCLLPVVRCDAKSGSMQLGAGDYTLELPVAAPDEALRVVILRADNRIEDGSRAALRSGDVVLIGLGTAGLVEVLGAPDLTPYLDRKPAAWEGDPLAEYALRSLPALIKAAGGALPVTVETFLPHTGEVFFSRRHQKASSGLPAGSINLGRVAGLVDERTALIRCGGGLVTAPMRDVVSGLPHDAFAAAAERLRLTREDLWLRGAGADPPSFGLGSDYQELNAVAATVLSVDLRPTTRIGLICRALESMKLYWLPERQVAWTSLTEEQLRERFPVRRTFRARLCSRERRTESLSIVEASEARKEFSDLAIGKEIVALVLALIRGEGGAPPRYLMESFNSRVILDCQTDGGEELAPGAEARVEIVRRSGGERARRLVTAVPSGTRRYELDLPAWMLTNRPRRGELRPEVQRLLGWFGANPPTLPPSTETAAKLGDEALEELLGHAYTRTDRGRDTVVLQTNAAEAWIDRSQGKPEIDLACALMAILLLHRNGENPLEIAAAGGLHLDVAEDFTRVWKSKAREMTQQLWRRALRSFHVEPLAQSWLSNTAARERRDDLWQRLQQLEISLRPPFDAAYLAMLRRFCRAVELRNSRDLVPISEGLRASMGELSSMDGVLQGAEVLRQLTPVGRTLPRSRASIHPDLHPAHVARLREILMVLRVSSISVTLLDPLPTVVDSESSG